jgi:3-deoxy-D-manno-octulosonate 8-phosphate phosphatase (KDO 8-P phosphatase)
MILTGRESDCVEKRGKELKIDYIYQGIKNKTTFLKKFLEDNEYNKENVAYIGDDLNDLEAMKMVKISACPSDAAEELKKLCTFQLCSKGGERAVRELIEYY